MTIGIVARGKGAGAALVNSLRGIEHVAEGAIGGFVSLIVIDANNKPTLFECQTGGALCCAPRVRCCVERSLRNKKRQLSLSVKRSPGIGDAIASARARGEGEG